MKKDHNICPTTRNFPSRFPKPSANAFPSPSRRRISAMDDTFWITQIHLAEPTGIIRVRSVDRSATVSIFSDSLLRPGSVLIYAVCAIPVRRGDCLKIFLIALFGAIGRLARYGVRGGVWLRLGSLFPWGTVLVNLCGCCLLGL